MIERPQFKASLAPDFSESGRLVILRSEHQAFVLAGALSCRLSRLLDGRHSVEEIVGSLSDIATRAEVYFALEALERKGYVVSSRAAVPPKRAAFWDTLGLDPATAECRLNQSSASVAVFGDLSPDALTRALESADIRVIRGASFAVVLTDDYLHDGLGEFNAHALRTGTPWLLAKPVGTIVWLGPLFRPGKTPCWECLAERVRRNRGIDTSVSADRQAGPASALAVSLQTAVQLVTMRAVLDIAAAPPISGNTTLTTVDLAGMKTRHHVVIRRPQCPACGEARPADAQPSPIVLSTERARLGIDNAYRIVTAVQTLARFDHHVSPISGIVHSIDRVTGSDDDELHVYVAHLGVTRAGSLTPELQRDLQTLSGGKGVTDAQARASALCEALERHSGRFHGDEIRRTATFRELGSAAVHPNACMLFSDRQYRRRDLDPDRQWGVGYVPQRFDEDAAIEWTPVWSLTAGRFRYLPTSYLYYRYPVQQGADFCRADSNGAAAGNTIEEAVLHGFMELAERDSVALWWYNRASRPGIDLDDVDDPYIQRVRSRYRSAGRDVWVLDLTTDLAVPAFAAISWRASDRRDLRLGFGAHFDPHLGVSRALTELNQFSAGSLLQSASAEAAAEGLPQEATAAASSASYLTPRGRRSLAAYPKVDGHDPRSDIVRCQSIVERAGLELLVLDQTRADVLLPVVKVLVPGLRHFWPRFAPGRLFRTVVDLGWRDRMLDEEELNPARLVQDPT